MSIILDTEQFKIPLGDCIGFTVDNNESVRLASDDEISKISIVNDIYVDEKHNQLSVLLFDSKIIYACKITEVFDHMFNEWDTIHEGELRTEEDVNDMLAHSMLVLAVNYVKKNKKT